MMDLCRTLADYPEIAPKDNTRVAVLTMSGAAGIVSSDFIEEHDLMVADLSAGTVDALKEIYPGWMPISNPVDLWPAVELHGRKKAYTKAFKAVCTDPKVDVILFHSFVGGDTFRPEISNLVEMAGRAGKPTFGWVMGERTETHKLQIQAKKLGLPVFRELYRAVECMAAVLSRNKLPEHRPSGISLTGTTRTEENLHDLLMDASGTLDEYQSKQILALCDFPVVEEKIVSSFREAKEIASEFGFPVVLKGLLPGEIHKTELGLVRTGISSVEEVESVLLELQKIMSGNGTLLIQKQIQGYPELIAGLIRDPQFGPCVMCGFGGVFTEVLADSVFAAAPINRVEALALIKRLKTRKLLDGFRGFAAVDRDTLADILVRIGELGLAYPQIKEIDLNPLIVSGGKPIAVDATIIIEKYSGVIKL
jgi:acetyltransferase